MYITAALFSILFALYLFYFFYHLQHSISLRKAWVFRKKHPVVQKLSEAHTSSMDFLYQTRLYKYIDQAYTCLDNVYIAYAETRHSGFLIVHTSLVVGGISLFMYDAWPRLESENEYVMLLYYILFTFIIACLGQTYYDIVTSDSGQVDLENHLSSMSHFEYDNFLYHPVMCKVCQFLRPPRSKHCRYCNRCIMLMDHHCVWLDLCIGRGNHVYFIKYLFSLFACVFTGTVLGARAIFLDLERSGLAHRLVTYPKFPHLPPAPLGLKYGFIYTCKKAPWTTVATTLAFATTIVLFFFIIIHIAQSFSGLTTYERDKLSHLSNHQSTADILYTRKQTWRERVFTVFGM